MKMILAVTLLVGPALAQTGTRPVTPLKATVVQGISKPGPDGSVSSTVTTGTYYRDSTGRTRLERGNTVVISDPVAHSTITLDLAAATARVVGATAAAPPGPGAPASGGANSAGSPPVSESTAPAAPLITSQAVGAREPVRGLGTMNINGFPASGFRGEAIFPAGMGGREFPTRVVSETWRADELRLHIKTTNTESAVKPGGDSLISQSVMEYRDFVQGATIDPALFQIPAAFKVTNAAAGVTSPAP